MSCFLAVKGVGLRFSFEILPSFVDPPEIINLNWLEDVKISLMEKNVECSIKLELDVATLELVFSLYTLKFVVNCKLFANPNVLFYRD